MRLDFARAWSASALTWRLSGAASPNAQRPGPQAVGGTLLSKPEEEDVVY